MTRPEVTAGPIDRARRPEKISEVKDCAKTGPAARDARKMNATRFITPYTLGARRRTNCDEMNAGGRRLVLSGWTVHATRSRRGLAALMVERRLHIFRPKSLTFLVQ